MKKVLAYAEENGLYPLAITNAPVRKGKNIEYVLYCKPRYVGAKTATQIVEEVKALTKANSLGELV